MPTQGREDVRWPPRFLIFPLTCGRFTCVSSGGGVRTLAACRFRILCGRRRENWPTAKALHLEYGKLKQRAEAAVPTVKRRMVKALAEGPRRARRTAPPTFVELMAPPPGSFPGAVVELEGPRGRMRIEIKGVAPAELVALSRALWSGEA